MIFCSWLSLLVITWMSVPVATQAIGRFSGGPVVLRDWMLAHNTTLLLAQILGSTGALVGVARIQLAVSLTRTWRRCAVVWLSVWGWVDTPMAVMARMHAQIDRAMYLLPGTAACIVVLVRLRGHSCRR